VVLDIGEDTGALVLYTPPSLHRREIEVDLLGSDTPRVHSAVLERSANGRTLYAAVYPELPAGVYTVCYGAAPHFTITPGRVTEVRLFLRTDGNLEGKAVPGVLLHRCGVGVARAREPR
jgi:hypothetical protein